MQGLFEGEVEGALEVEDGEGVGAGFVEDGFVAADCECGQSAGELIDPVDEVPVEDFEEEGEVEQESRCSVFSESGIIWEESMPPFFFLFGLFDCCVAAEEGTVFIGLIG